MGLGAGIKTIQQGTTKTHNQVGVTSEVEVDITITAVGLAKSVITIMWASTDDDPAPVGIRVCATLSSTTNLKVYILNSNASTALAANSVRITWEVIEYF